MINFIMSDSYMQPHRHPHEEKIEKILVLRGKMGQLFFDDKGKVTEAVILEAGKKDYIEIPAFSWHTYVVLSEYAITYETMRGVYDPATWKEFPAWAPKENTPQADSYFDFLKHEALEGKNAAPPQPV
jgi:cupin fold WbuC family metalloprotein